MKEIIFVVEEAAEGGFICHALGAAIFTEGDTVEELHENIRDAIECHFSDAPKEKPAMARLH